MKFGRMSIQHPVTRGSKIRNRMKLGSRFGRATLCEFELNDGSRGIFRERRASADIITQLRQLYGDSLKGITYLNKAKQKTSNNSQRQTRSRRRLDIGRPHPTT